MDKLIESMGKIVDMATTGVTAGVDLLMAQAPDIVHQFLMYRAVLFGITAFGLLLVIIASIVIPWIVIVKAIKAKRSEYSDVNILVKVILPSVSLIGGFCSIFSFIPLFYVNFTQFLYIWIAPKVYLIEFFSTLVKK